LCLLSPLELVLFFDELKERESPDAESQDKPTQSGHASRQLLHVLEALGRLHFGDSRHLLWVRVNTMIGDHIPEYFSGGHTECTLLRVQLHFEFSQVVKGLCHVRDESGLPESLQPRRQHTLQRCTQAVNADTVVYRAGKLHPRFLVRKA
jgi:hypothetical protein